jgi:hypothetical protein
VFYLLNNSDGKGIEVKVWIWMRRRENLPGIRDGYGYERPKSKENLQQLFACIHYHTFACIY